MITDTLTGLLVLDSSADERSSTGVTLTWGPAGAPAAPGGSAVTGAASFPDNQKSRSFS